ncbi:hypothetical protein B0H14DRAFT_3146077 [Mycena olivaceomarginata]|nr:hypothetical protein B0H14DRAFT_3146077 [Mycena olivaceomarginata]
MYRDAGADPDQSAPHPEAATMNMRCLEVELGTPINRRIDGHQISINGINTASSASSTNHRRSVSPESPHDTQTPAWATQCWDPRILAIPRPVLAASAAQPEWAVRNRECTAHLFPSSSVPGSGLAMSGMGIGLDEAWTRVQPPGGVVQCCPARVCCAFDGRAGGDSMVAQAVVYAGGGG